MNTSSNVCMNASITNICLNTCVDAASNACMFAASIYA